MPFDPGSVALFTGTLITSFPGIEGWRECPLHHPAENPGRGATGRGHCCQPCSSGVKILPHFSLVDNMVWGDEQLLAINANILPMLGIRIQEGKNYPQKHKKVNKFYFLKYWGLKASP